MTRSKWKGPHLKIDKTGKMLVARRDSEVTLSFVGAVVWVHDGRSLNKLEITEKMVGHKVGEFVPTRSEFVFKKKKKK